MGKIDAPTPGHLYHGVYPGGPDGSETEVSKDNLTAYLSAVGRCEVAWVYFSHEWSKGREFPADQVEWIHTTGAAPFVRLMLRSSDEQFVCEPLFTLKSIAAGCYDADLKAWGRAAAKRGIPLICEWGTEMNGLWFSWNAAHNGAEKGGPLFKEAYKRIIGMIRDGGAKDITWVFHVNHENDPKADWNKFASYDPGSGFTQWIGFSLYGGQKPCEIDDAWFSKRLPCVYEELCKLEGDRPIMVCEFGHNLNNPEGDPLVWTRDAFDTILDVQKWPRLKGFSWWNEGWPNDDDPAHNTEMRIQTSEPMKKLFQDTLKANAAKLVERPIVAIALGSAVSRGTRAARRAGLALM